MWNAMPRELHPRARVSIFIAAVGRRRWLLHFALSLAAAAIVTLGLTVTAHVAGRADEASPLRRPLAYLGGAIAMALSYRLRDRRASAMAIERAVPDCRNLVVTAEELERHSERASAAMTHRVLLAADAALADVGPGHVVPSSWIIGALAVAVIASVLAAPQGQRAIRESIAAATRARPSSAGPPHVRVRVEPPAYARRPDVTLETPLRLEALEGSRLTFELGGPGRVRFGDTPIAGTVVARESGYFAVEHNGGKDADGERTLLIPLTVTRDHAPVVTIGAPGKDLLLPDGDRTIPVTIQAADDLALENLELRFTKVSGTGEQFEFQEGTLPVQLQRISAREWRATGELALGALRLGPGDSLVYRAVAGDQRPGLSGNAASDTYFIEIAGPGQVALAGVDMPPVLERYAMSQQMIVLKIERLRARAAALSKEAMAEDAGGIAAEQRTVRANFIFLLGGHVDDEEVEAEQSHEIQEGRLENTARKDINAAISQMTRAEQGLTASNPTAALPPARAAVESLQRAFGRSRYLLRALAARSRLDPSRRLTGNLEDAGNWQRLPAEPDPREGEAARLLLERLLDAAQAAKPGEAPPPRLDALAESALAIDSTSAVWQEVARRLLEAKDSDALHDIISRVAAEARRGGLPRTPLAKRLSPLSRAFQAERRP
jgi:hypothetical protein